MSQGGVSFLLFLKRLLHAETGVGKAERRRFFLFFHEVHEFAPPAVMQFLSEGFLNLATTERTLYHPSGSSGIVSSMDSIKRLQSCNGADTELQLFMPARLTTALFVFPTIHFLHLILQIFYALLG
jgi:hypothetical protein